MFQKLLVPLDGTPTTAAALAPAVALSRRLGAAIDLLYVASDRGGRSGERGSIGAPQYMNHWHYEWPAWAREVRDWFSGCCAQSPGALAGPAFFAQGEIGPTITQFVGDHGEDAVVLVRRSRLEPGRAPALRGVLEHTRWPILLVGGPPSELDLAGQRAAARAAPRGSPDHRASCGRDVSYLPAGHLRLPPA